MSTTCVQSSGSGFLQATPEKPSHYPGARLIPGNQFARNTDRHPILSDSKGSAAGAIAFGTRDRREPLLPATGARYIFHRRILLAVSL